MEHYGIGMMAKSLAGHDKGKIYMIVSMDESYLYLADGKIRGIDNPKKKKFRHVQVNRQIPGWMKEILNQGKKIQNSDIIRAGKECSI